MPNSKFVRVECNFIYSLISVIRLLNLPKDNYIGKEGLVSIAELIRTSPVLYFLRLEVDFKFSFFFQKCN